MFFLVNVVFHREPGGMLFASNQPIKSRRLFTWVALLLGLSTPATFAAESLPVAVGGAPLTTATPLRGMRQMHGSAVLGRSLYVVGGALGFVYTNTADVAPILSDGTLGPWRTTAPLPQQRSYIWNSTLALNDVLYVAGGFIEGHESDKTRKSNTVAWTTAEANGDLARWRESPPWPGQGVSNMTAAVTPGFLHVLGGFDEDNKPSAAVYSGRIAPEGGVAEWVEAPPIPKALWFHNSGVLGGRVWVWGGLLGGGNTTTSRQVFSSAVLSDGRLGGWREEVGAEMPIAYYSAACTSVGNYLIAACPRLTGGKTSSDIWFSAFDGRKIGPWQRMSSKLEVKRYIPLAPDFRSGLVYVTGGRKEGGTVSRDVLILRFTGSGMTGFDQSYFATITPTVTTASSHPLPSGVEESLTHTAAARTQTQTGTTQAPPLAMAGAIPAGFYSLDQARRFAEIQPRRPMLLYFHHDSVEPCIKQKALLSQTGFKALSERASFGWIEVRDSPQLVQQLGVFKVPAWILYDSSGNEAGRVLDFLTLDQLRAGLDEAR